MAAFLVTWRPWGEIPESGWPDSELSKLVRRFDRSGIAVESWPFGAHKKAKLGERVFAIRQGRRGHALFGFGRISRIQPSKKRADIEFLGLVDPAKKLFATEIELHKISPEKSIWGTRFSGRELPDSVAARLEKLVMRRTRSLKKSKHRVVSVRRGKLPSIVTDVFVDPPKPSFAVKKRPHTAATNGGRKIDYSARDKANKVLGRSGEKFVVMVERKRLVAYGRTDLAKRVEWTADVKGDGYGFDVLSFDEKTGAKRYIEVKTTKGSELTPFVLTGREVDFGRTNSKSFRIYRVFSFQSNPRIFKIKGISNKLLDLRPTEFRASLRRMR